MQSKSEQAAAREQRLAAKLRENLKRRKGQAKARAESELQAPDSQSQMAAGAGTVKQS